MPITITAAQFKKDTYSRWFSRPYFLELTDEALEVFHQRQFRMDPQQLYKLIQEDIV